MIIITELAPGAVRKRAFDVNTGDTLLIVDERSGQRLVIHWLVQRVVRGFGYRPLVTLTALRDRDRMTNDFILNPGDVVHVIPR